MESYPGEVEGTHEGWGWAAGGEGRAASPGFS